MGDTKKIDIPALVESCKAFYPALKAAAALEKAGIADAMSETEYTKFSDIKSAAHCSVSGTCNFLADAVKTGVVEKDPTKPLYRLKSYNSALFLAVRKRFAIGRAEVVVFSFIRNASIFEALQNSELCLGEIQQKIGLAQSPASLKMSRLYEYGWVDRRRDGKNVYYSISDHTRRTLAALAGAGL